VAIDREKVLQAAQKYVEKKKYDKAVLEYQKLVQADPNDARTLLKIGDLQTKMGTYPDAISTYEGVGRLYAQQGFALKAIAVYKQIRELIAKHAPTLDERYGHITPKLAELYEQLGLVSDALAALDEVATRFQRQQRDDEAIAVCQKIVQLDPSEPPAAPAPGGGLLTHERRRRRGGVVPHAASRCSCKLAGATTPSRCSSASCTTRRGPRAGAAVRGALPPARAAPRRDARAREAPGVLPGRPSRPRHARAALARVQRDRTGREVDRGPKRDGEGRARHGTQRTSSARYATRLLQLAPHDEVVQRLAGPGDARAHVPPTPPPPPTADGAWVRAGPPQGYGAPVAPPSSCASPDARRRRRLPPSRRRRSAGWPMRGPRRRCSPPPPPPPQEPSQLRSSTRTADELRTKTPTAEPEPEPEAASAPEPLQAESEPPPEDVPHAARERRGVPPCPSLRQGARGARTRARARSALGRGLRGHARHLPRRQAASRRPCRRCSSLASLNVDALDGDSAARTLQDVLAYDPQQPRARHRDPPRARLRGRRRVRPSFEPGRGDDRRAGLHRRRESAPLVRPRGDGPQGRVAASTASATRCGVRGEAAPLPRFAMEARSGGAVEAYPNVRAAPKRPRHGARGRARGVRVLRVARALDDAYNILVGQLERYPNHPLLRERLAELEYPQRIGERRPRTPPSAARPTAAFAIAESLDVYPEAPCHGGRRLQLSGDEQVDVEEVFQSSKRASRRRSTRTTRRPTTTSPSPTKRWASSTTPSASLTWPRATKRWSACARA
jgi:hypothetical protein